MRSALAGSALLVALVLPAGAAAGSVPAPKDDVRLSDERTLTRWAHPAGKGAPIRSRPSPGANRITRTHARTEDGFKEVYLALRSRSDSRGRTWIKVRIPMRPGVSSLNLATSVAAVLYGLLNGSVSAPAR